MDGTSRVLTANTHGDLGPALASLPDTNVDRVLRLAAKSGPIRRRGAWRVPRVVKVESEYGGVNLDLSRAIIEYPVVDIQMQLRFGAAKITLPADAVVDLNDLRTDWRLPTSCPRRARSRRAEDPNLREYEVRAVEGPAQAALRAHPLSDSGRR